MKEEEGSPPKMSQQEAFDLVFPPGEYKYRALRYKSRLPEKDRYGDHLDWWENQASRIKRLTGHDVETGTLQDWIRKEYKNLPLDVRCPIFFAVPLNNRPLPRIGRGFEEEEKP